MVEIRDKQKCSGCFACINICPKKCIVMEEDHEGFLYPHVNKNICINCGLCEKACPLISKIEEKENSQQKGFIICHKNDKIRKESTSGGAFTAIAEWIIDHNGIVFGAAFDDLFVVRHQYVDRKEELYKFRNSKYVQSAIGEETFIKVKEFLNKGRWVCFSGTPCQIEGCYSFLGKDYEKLILVDVMCRAVPSPKVFRAYLKNQKKVYGQIGSCLFRDKNIYGYKYSQLVLKGIDDKVLYHNGIDTDKWLRIFFSGIANRPSCYSCQFRKRYRISDFTLWDCFEVGKFSKELDDNKGATRCLVHTKKGGDVLANINSVKKVQISPELLIGRVKEMHSSLPINKNRNRFFQDLSLHDFNDIGERYFPSTVGVFLERNIRKVAHKMGLYKLIRVVFKELFGEKKR